VIESIDYYK